MIWTPARVAGFATIAGFVGPDLGRAVALSLASTGGDDAWRYRAGVPPAVDQRGLWALDVARYPELGAYDLTRPDIAAGRAFARYLADGRTFTGFAPVTGDALEAVIPAARAAAAHPTFAQPVSTQVASTQEGSTFARAYNGTLALLDRFTRPLLGG